uniref:Uncharacterized protein n=1 Tax=Globisporangium ultimum (strain ATCC 200006 / CBS 805.95 / DAOM BR144) TaxID=431595 RepID=K3X410_GLOUD
SKIEDAKKHGLLHLSQCHLQLCPSALFATPELSTSLFRLDLSFNLLESIPDAIGNLIKLQVLWLSHNPRLASLPAALTNCSNLQVLDVNSTAIHALPYEYGRLQYVKVLDIGSTPLEKRWIKKNHLTATSGNDDDEPNDLITTATRCQELMTQLRRKDERAQLKHALFEKLHDEVYRMECADTASATALRRMLQRVLKHFPLADELRSLIRNAERLFPSPDFMRGITVLENADPVEMRRTYEALRDTNDRNKRAADLEIKIRSLYFDRIDPTTVEGMVKSIYAHIPDLQDIKFLIKHAAALFPKHAREVDGQEIQRKLVALQQEIAHERSAAIDKLLAVVKALYNDTEPDQVLNLVIKVAALFKNTKELRSLTADVPVVFPVEFLNANPLKIRAVFLRMKA